MKSLSTVLLFAMFFLIWPTGSLFSQEPSMRDQEKMTIRSMRQIYIAIASYETDYGYYPQANSVQEVIKYLVPDYAKELQTKDAWGNEFYLKSTKDHYELRSFGADGVRDKGAPKGPTNDPNDDIIYVDDNMVQCPKGLCS